MTMMDYDFGPSEDYRLRKKFAAEYDSMEAPNKSRSLYVAQKLADHYSNITDSHNSLIANNTRDAIIYINSNYYYIYNNVITEFLKTHDKKQKRNLYICVYDHLENLFGEMDPHAIEIAFMKNNIWSTKRLNKYCCIDIAVITSVLMIICYFFNIYDLICSALIISIVIVLIVSIIISINISDLIDNYFRQPISISKWGSR